MPLFDSSDPTGVESDTDQSWLGRGSLGRGGKSDRSDPGNLGNYSKDPNAYNASNHLLSAEQESQAQDAQMDYEHRVSKEHREKEEGFDRKWSSENHPDLQRVNSRLQAIQDRMSKMNPAQRQAHQQAMLPNASQGQTPGQTPQQQGMEK
jgi:hypothetical protein